MRPQANQCRMYQVRSWPAPRRTVDALRYIGPRITNRFGNRNIYTLQDLIDYINGHTLANNSNMFRYVLRNERNRQCVFRSESINYRRETKHWPNPWPNPPYNLPNNHASRPGLVPGDFEYCVRRYNRCGWEIIEAYLRQRNDVNYERIPPAPARDGYCRQRLRSDPGPNWCLRPPQEEEEEEEESSGIEEEQELEEMERNVEQFIREHGRGPHREEQVFHPQLEQAQREADQDQRHLIDLFAGRLANLDNAQRIAYVLWFLASKDEPVESASVNMLAELTGRSPPTVRKYLAMHLYRRGDRLFALQRKGWYTLRPGIFRASERQFLSQIS